MRLRDVPSEVGFWCLYRAIRLLPVATAGAVLGGLAATIGPLLPASRRARENLDLALPEADATARRRIVRGAWETLARIAADYIHIDAYRDAPERIEVVGAEHIARLRDDGRPGIVFSAHLANWGMATLACARDGLELAVLYRAFNDPVFDRYARRLQEGEGLTVLTKGAAGGRALARHLAGGGHVFLLADQRLNRGVAVPFLGVEARTAPALAVLALRYDAPLLPVQVERIGRARYRVTAHPPIEPAATGAREADIRRLLTAVNAEIERWVRARPEQWLWLHRRWGKRPGG